VEFKEIITNIVIGLCTGLLSGIYSGLVVARVSLWAQARQRARSALTTIDLIQVRSGDAEVWLQEYQTRALVEAACELLELGHRQAYETLMSVVEEIRMVRQLPRSPESQQRDQAEKHGEWLRRVTRLPMDWWTCLSLRRL